MPLIILFLAISLQAQESTPMWIQDNWRSVNYPSAEWYTGFVRDKVNENPNKAKFKEMEKAAQNSLSENIIVNISGTSTLEKTSVQKSNNETISRNYKQEITSTSNAVLAKMETHSYFDKASGYIYGFAAVKKKDQADFYRSSINSIFSFAEKEFIRAEAFTEQGKKNSAFGKIQEIEDSLKNVAYWGKLLQTVESDNSYIKREQDFWQKLNEAKKSLEHGTTIYLDISGDNDLEALGAEMQEKGCNCSIAESSSNVDYIVKIKIKLGSCVENALSRFGEIYCYASANVLVNNTKYKKPMEVKIPEAKGGWGNRNKEKATAQAIKELTNNLAEKIIQSINGGSL